MRQVEKLEEMGAFCSKRQSNWDFGIENSSGAETSSKFRDC